MMRKICVVITARASYSRVKTVLSAINSHAHMELQLVVCASALLEKFGSTQCCMEHDGFRVTARIFNMLEPGNNTSSAKTTGLGLIELSNVFENIRPDIVVTIADRFETMATAIAASYMNIPLAHIQGGEVTGNIDEKVRHAVTKLSDFHFVATAAAKQRIMKLGECPGRIYFTGCPSIDLAMVALNTESLTFDPYQIYGGVGTRPDLSKPYIVVLQHPLTTEFEDSGRQVHCTLDAIAKLKIPVLWFWPNADHGTNGTSQVIRRFREINRNIPIHFFKNMHSDHFLNLLRHAACLVGNSSTGIREAACLGVPVVNIGGRQLGRERGRNVVDVEPLVSSILNALAYQVNHGPYCPDFLYGKGDAGKRIAELLHQIPLSSNKQMTY
jgi:UDP-hydrolysing UDP-N-acetyl-D-glucosamine 2-epimerase